MVKRRSSLLIRKKCQRKHAVKLLCTTARPPQERWSIRESANFKIAFDRFGQDWPRVAQFVSTKTTLQISVYAEKYFLKQRLTFQVK
ncbi:hypothetical protein BRADI_4g27285v3 [Brachypodium distachyon]|uniref:SANT domain-containing protein n=1 Tax=Brachypodium distachyon TaxID=15368 RepID=A0A2K2CQJ8_BRADI|nr:hypothetical protein BRADI_4g27285v3 [Brachypodium distachyon]